MKSAFWGRWLLVFFMGAGSAFLRAQDDSAPPPISVSMQASQLYAQVRSIAASRSMSRRKKEEWIANAVRVAVIASTAYNGGSDDALATAGRLAAAAARGAPAYAELIAKSAAYAPTVVRISGAVGRIRATTLAAARGRSYPPPLPPSEYVAAAAPRRRTPPPDEDTMAGSPVPAAANPAADSSYAGDALASDESAPAERPRRHHVDIDSNTSVHATLDLSALHNDNVYLSPKAPASSSALTAAAGPVGDTILTATPGISAGFGQHSIAHGEIAAREAFTHYTGHSAPDAHFASVTADLGYQGDIVKTSANGSYQQAYQNNADYTTTGARQLLRTDLSQYGASFESAFTAKTGGRVGVSFSGTDYKTSQPSANPTQLVGNHVVSVPAALLYKPDPDVDLSTGVTYSRTTPAGDGPSSKDLYYNVGANGQFTEKLSGNFSVGYSTRHVDQISNGKPVTGPTDKESLWAFSGGFTYQATEKTSGALTLSRNFSSGAFGQSTKSTNIGLQLTSNLTPQLTVSAGGGWNRIDYGPVVFVDLAHANPNAIARVDDGWQGNLSVSYTFTSWCSAIANYTFRNNRSRYNEVTNLIVPNFDNNLFSLALGLQY